MSIRFDFSNITFRDVAVLCEKPPNFSKIIHVLAKYNIEGNMLDEVYSIAALEFAVKHAIQEITDFSKTPEIPEAWRSAFEKDEE